MNSSASMSHNSDNPLQQWTMPYIVEFLIAARTIFEFEQFQIGHTVINNIGFRCSCNDKFNDEAGGNGSLQCAPDDAHDLEKF